MQYRQWLWVLGLVAAVGCGAQEPARISAKSDFRSAGQSAAAEAAYDGAANYTVDVLDDSQSMPLADREIQLAQADGQPPRVTVARAERKIIYNGQISLVVNDFAEAERELPKLIAAHDGFEGNVTIHRTTGQQRSGQWVARIPVARFQSFLAALSALGYPEGRSQTAQDVSDQYFDIEARIKNGKVLEQRVLKLLDDRDGKIKDVIDVERELARIREQIERLEGQLRRLADLTALSTVTINVREELNYTPPEAPTFLARASTGWSGSTRALFETAQAVALFLLVMLPWAVSLTVLSAPGIFLVRRQLRAAAEHRRELLARIAAGGTDAAGQSSQTAADAAPPSPPGSGAAD